MKNENLGKQATDTITGFKGLTTGYSEYLTGCAQYCLQPKTKDGAFVEGRWFDEGKIKFSSKVSVKQEDIAGREKGCDCTSPRVG